MISTLQKQWHYFLTAVMFFTRVPVRFSTFDNADLNKATRYFPLIGILVGAIGALVFWLSDILLPLEIALLLSMASTILLTGAFHEDGLADAVDGLGGGWSREQVLAIMIDSRIGSYGAIGLFLVLLTKYQTLTYQWVALIPATLITGHALSRLCAVLVMYTQSYVKAEGKAKPLGTQPTITELTIATFFGLVPLAFLEMKFLMALVPVAIVWLWFSAKIKSRIGGYTGDCLGAMQQLTELAFYVGVLASTTLFPAP
ncbi:MAG: adenosylcobinamide-GDP ribazoletransferase [Methylotenera sp.]|uniref:adenosylcobinamide-GDP ribazoletransferase n=1 Tax=Methylotenera sp. TaxID=2051956 RepID=UPI0024884CBC|nr:adenosylcobinamide-GDP ribazoletransferase [Methylotenera sp.]MDI1308190.1 adenosylcobinamide-GDP ribazoletransferase [Methylotenera sp.]